MCQRNICGIYGPVSKYQFGVNSGTNAVNQSVSADMMLLNSWRDDFSHHDLSANTPSPSLFFALYLCFYLLYLSLYLFMYPCIGVSTYRHLSIPKASPCPKERSRELLNDGSCWTIIGTETVEYTFSESLTCSQDSISPVPVITALEVRTENMRLGASTDTKACLCNDKALCGTYNKTK